MNTIQDPLASQKTAAANIGLGNYQTASAMTPSLQNYYNQNFGQTQQQTLQNQSPLFQDVYGQINQDVAGQGGPYSALTQNLLGSFDTQQKSTQDNLEQQLQAQGLGGSGAGMAVLGNEGVQAAQARAGIVDQNQVNELNMANSLAQELQGYNQQAGFSNPMAALGQVQSLSSPPQFQSPETTYYTPSSKFQTTADILGAVASVVQNGLLSPQTIQSISGGVNPSSPVGNGAPSLGAPSPSPSNYYTGGGQGVQSMLNNPQLLQMLMASGGG